MSKIRVPSSQATTVSSGGKLYIDVELTPEDMWQMRRTSMCGYCGEVISTYPTDFPTDADHEAALLAFQGHDRVCSRNPLATRVRELEAQLRGEPR